MRKKTKPKDAPLDVGVIGEMLVISVGIETLMNGFNLAGFKIVDSAGFAKDVANYLCRTREDGSGIVTDLLEKAVLGASESGSTYVILGDPFDIRGHAGTWE